MATSEDRHKIPSLELKSPRFKLPPTPKQAKAVQRLSLGGNSRKISDFIGSTQGTFTLNSNPISPKRTLEIDQRDSIFENRKQSASSSRGLTGFLQEFRVTKKKKSNFSLNVVSKFNLDDKKRIPRLTPVMITRQNSPDVDKNGGQNEIVQKYSEGKELPDYKQYNGPFNIAHIPEEGVKVEIDESEIDIIDRIANIDGAEDDPIKIKMQCFSDIKSHIVQNQMDYYNQYKHLREIIEAERFFDGNKVANYSQMLQKTQTNQLFPRKLGLLKPFTNSLKTSNNSSRRESDVLLKTQKTKNLQNATSQRSIQSSRSIALSIKSPQASPMLSRMTSISIQNKNGEKSQNLIQQSNSPTNNAFQQQLSLFSGGFNKLSKLHQENNISSSNLQDFPSSNNNSPMATDKNFKTSKFRMDLASPQKREEGPFQQGLFLEQLKPQENGKAEEQDHEELESPVLKQIKAKLPFFMKINNKQIKSKQGDSLLAELNKLIKQRALTNQSERAITQNNSYASSMSIISTNEIKLKNQQTVIAKIKERRANTNTANEEQLNLNYYSLNDKQATVISAGVNEVKKFKVIKLSKNRISNDGLSNFMLNMPSNIKNLDISYNCFTHVGLVPFIDRISNSGFTQLLEINIEGNNLGDKSISRLLTALTEYSKLQKLNLSKNSLTVISIAQLTNFIIQSSSTRELYLRWNKYKADAGMKIAEALMENDTIRVLDLSYNSLGISNNSKYLCAKAFAKLIEKDYKCDLIHVDLSYNQFNFEESTILSDALKKNFSIYGFHFSGNSGTMDQYGFLNPARDVSDVISPLETRIQGVKRIDYSNKKISASKENCWICQGWEERKFIWRPLISGEVQEEPIFVHISTENYEPRKMEKIVNGNLVQFMYRGMFPPNTKIFYFFVAYGHCLYAKEQTNEEINLTNILIKYSDQNQLVPLIKTLNTFTTNKAANQVINEETYDCQVKQTPRRQNFLYPKPQVKELKLIWTLSMSVFQEYQNELDENLLDQCFEFDIKNSQIEQYITNDYLSFKKKLKTYYKQIKDVFKYYSSFKPFLGERWTIPIEIFIQLLNSGPFEIVDEKDLKKCSIAVIFDQCNQNEKKNNNTPPKQLARHNFLLALLRVADIKYIQSGQVQDHKLALELLFDKGFQKVCDSVQCEHIWRTYSLWNQDVDLVLQYYKPLINYVFNKYSQKSVDAQLQSVIQQATIQFNNQSNGSNSAQNIIRFMSLNEFKSFVYENVKEISLLSITDIQKCFNLSIQTQVDQINKYRYLYMNLLEFYESLARLAHLLIIYPVGYDYFDESTLTHFKDIDLCCKLESMLVKIFQKRKDETKVLSEITVSETSLFDQKIREFMYSKQIIQNQLYRQETMVQHNTKSSSRYSPQPQLNKKTSIVLPTPLDYAESTLQLSNPMISCLSPLESPAIDAVRNTIIDGKIVRRSNSLAQNVQSIYFQPPSQEEFQNGQLGEYGSTPRIQYQSKTKI